MKRPQRRLSSRTKAARSKSPKPRRSAFRVQTANRAFYKLFLLTPGEVENRVIYDLGQGEWKVRGLRTLLEHVLPGMRAVEDFQLEGKFYRVGRKRLLLNARALLNDQDEPHLVVLSVKDQTQNGLGGVP